MARATSTPLSKSVTWSTQQQAIFEWFTHCARTVKRSLVVIARAGSGKTTTVVNAIKHHLRSDQSVAFFAFARSNVSDLESKLHGSKCIVKTIHGLGYQIIRDNWSLRKRNAVDSRRAWKLAEAVTFEDTPKQVISLISRLHTKCRELTVTPTTTEVIEIAYRFDLTPSEGLLAQGYDITKIAQLTISAMDLAAKGPTEGAVDFADMVWLPLRNGWLKALYDVVIVDEYQDMGSNQLAIVRATFRDSLIVIGDTKQAIYGFRGADSTFAKRIETELDADTLTLTRTFRCGRAIVDVAKRIVPEFEAHGTNPAGSVEYMKSSDDIIIASAPGDVVLSRYNAPIIKLALKYLRRGIPAKMLGRSFHDSIKRVIDELATTSSNSVTTFLARLTEWRDREIRRASATGLTEEALAGVVDIICDKAASIEALTDGSTNVTEVKQRLDRIFEDINSGRCVTLSSVHKFKGKEAPRVYLLADTLKYDNTEERNIAYVAVTRAIDTLVLVGGDVMDTSGDDDTENDTSIDDTDADDDTPYGDLDEQRDKDLIDAKVNGGDLYL